MYVYGNYCALILYVYVYTYVYEFICLYVYLVYMFLFSGSRLFRFFEHSLVGSGRFGGSGPWTTSIPSAKRRVSC